MSLSPETNLNKRPRLIYLSNPAHSGNTRAQSHSEKHRHPVQRAGKGSDWKTETILR